MSIKGIASMKMIVAMMIVGGFVALNKVVSASLPIFLFSELRLSLAAIILMVIVIIKEKKLTLPNKKDAGILFIQALLGVFLFSIFLLLGSKYTSAIESGIITSLTPSFVALISLIFFKERLRLNNVIGIAIALVGVLMINIFGMNGDIQVTFHSIIGNLFILLAVMGESFFVTLGKLVSKTISPLMISCTVIFIGSVLCLPFAIYEGMTFDFSQVTVIDLFLLLYSGIAVSVIAVLLINQSNKILSGGATAVFTAIMPVSAISVSCLLLGEKIQWYHSIGISCVLFSIILVSINKESIFKKTIKYAKVPVK